ncbi:DSD1 family PLP-dependent enzyme [Vibrio campbellii]|uniref:DSD1 family PLP-dependent enzyme n=1 Tax=Vibrio campbellii TaxID=680 RepID=UPI0006828A38|nr:DSD1 family PLP-dependent enzyme [Vibrio campbellii]OPH52750.1 threonine aldolase [Vibrio campbellii]
MDINQLETPSLFVDIDKMKTNIKAMQQRINDLGLTLRPHTKAHKIPAIAQMQLDAGAQGICVAKLGEAEVMAQGGIKDILITTPIAGQKKIQRLITLHQDHPDARFIQVIDDYYHVVEIAKAASAANLCVELMIEVESGQQRCGVQVGDDLVQLIHAIQITDGVSYVGLQAYSGHLQHVKGYCSRNEQARSVVVPLFDFITSTLEPQGMAPQIISGGGTGTYAAYQGLGYSEIQAGSYLFMDAAYLAIGDETNATENQQFSPALKVLSTVISQPTPSRTVIDAGMKCLSIDLGMPIVEGSEGVRYQTGGDEHGILHHEEGCEIFELGQQVILLPSHCDTTLNNFDTLYAVQDGKVVCQWTIEGRGRSD